MKVIIQLQYSLTDSRVFHDVKNITQSSLHPTQPNPTHGWTQPITNSETRRKPHTCACACDSEEQAVSNIGIGPASLPRETDREREREREREIHRLDRTYTTFLTRLIINSDPVFVFNICTAFIVRAVDDAVQRAGRILRSLSRCVCMYVSTIKRISLTALT